MISIRCSSLPRIMACEASLIPPAIKVARESGPAADVGTAAHEVFAATVLEDFPPWSRIPEIAAKHGVDEGELRFLAANGSKLWARLRPLMAEVAVERYGEIELGNSKLTGTCDVEGRTSPVDGVIVDWKTGRVDHDYTPQLLGYASIALVRSPHLERVVVYTAWVRELEIEQRTVTRAQAGAWLAQLSARLADPSTHRPGAHCQYCPRWGECEAATRAYRTAAIVLTGTSEITPDLMLSLYDALSLVEKQAAIARKAIREHIEANGPLVGEGRTLSLVPQERRGLVTRKALPVLQSRLGDAWVDCCEVSIGDAIEKVREAAPRGQKKDAQEALEADLTAAGAIEARAAKVLTMRRS